MHEEPLPQDDPSIFYDDASYGIYNDMAHEIVLDSSDMEAEYSYALVPMVNSPRPTERPDSGSRTAHGDLLCRAVEALRCQVTNTTNKLYTEQGPDSSRAFLSTLSTLCTLPNEDFARFCAGIHPASTSYYSDTPPASDVGSPSREEKARQLVRGTHNREEKLEKFILHVREALIQLIDNHWERVASGLQVQRLQGDPFSSDKRMRRVYHYHELRRLRQETELHWLQRALSLIRNLRDFQEYLEENGYRPSDTSNHRIRHAYLVYIYTAGFGSSDLNIRDIKIALKEDLRYAVRWMIFINQLGLGAVLVCGEVIAKLVYKTSGNNNDDLNWLASQIRQCHRIDFGALCDIFDSAMADLLRYYQVKNPLNKFEIIAKIETVISRPTAAGIITKIGLRS